MQEEIDIENSNQFECGKKNDLPAMPFYIGDWKKDPAISSLTREEKMIWFEMIMLMWESKERGFLTIKGNPMSLKRLANSLHLTMDETQEYLDLFEDIDLYSRRSSDGAIYSRRIVKLVELSEKRQKAGKSGGNHSLNNKTNKSGYVYAISKSSDNKVKINSSTIPRKRINEIKKEYSSENIELLGKKFVVDMLLSEEEIHNEFAKNTQKGEWFDLSKEDTSRLVDYLSDDYVDCIPNGIPNTENEGEDENVTEVTFNTNNNIINKDKDKNNKREKKQKEITLTTKLKNVFNEFYNSLTQSEYVWNVKEMTNIKRLGDNLKVSAKSRGLPCDDETIVQNFNLLLSKINDTWILERLSPSILYSKYNEIILKIKSQNNGKTSSSTSGKQPATSNEQLAELLKKGFDKHNNNVNSVSG